MNRTIKVLLILNLLILTGVLFRSSLASRPVAAQASAKDNQELTRLMGEDQADRTPPTGKSIDWKVIAPRDEARLKRTRELYSQDELQTGNDFFNAALILQHSDKAEDYLLAHELCIVAVSKRASGESLAAASEDRFLMSIGRPQRFGTQYKAAGPNQPYRLYPVEPGVTDQVRRLLMVPSLAEAKAQEAKWNKKE